MITQFKIEYLSEEEKEKLVLLRQTVAVFVRLEGETHLVDAIIALLKTKYPMIY